MTRSPLRPSANPAAPASGRSSHQTRQLLADCLSRLPNEAIHTILAQLKQPVCSPDNIAQDAYHALSRNAENTSVITMLHTPLGLTLAYPVHAKTPPPHSVMIHLVRARQVDPFLHSDSVHYHRALIRTWKSRLITPHTSGDIESLLMPSSSSLFIVSSAKPSRVENRSGNFIAVNLASSKTWFAPDLHTIPCPAPEGTVSPPAPIFITVSVLLYWNNLVLTAGGCDERGGQVRLTHLNSETRVWIPELLADLPSPVRMGCQSPYWPQICALGCENGAVILINLDRLVNRDPNAWTTLLRNGQGVEAMAFGHGESGRALLLVGYSRGRIKPKSRWMSTGYLCVWDISVGSDVIVPGLWEQTGVRPLMRELFWPWPITAVAVDPVDSRFAYFATGITTNTEEHNTDGLVHQICLYDKNGSTSDPVEIYKSLFSGISDTDIIVISPCGNFLCAAGNSQHVVVFDLVDPMCKPILLPHYEHVENGGYNVYDLKWLSRSNLLCSVGGNGVARFWDVAQAKAWVPSWKEASLGAYSGAIVYAWIQRKWDLLFTSHCTVPDHVLNLARAKALEYAQHKWSVLGASVAKPWYEIDIKSGEISRVCVSPLEDVMGIGISSHAIVLDSMPMPRNEGGAGLLDTRDVYDAVIGTNTDGCLADGEVGPIVPLIVEQLGELGLDLL